eukprot:PLAT13364.2.p1 GENE.PLAT13364.2~~PLAT13364.2.p1  ORF type:complete len:155 (-),score=62.38 PLAT13364.2:46-510(-)
MGDAGVMAAVVTALQRWKESGAVVRVLLIALRRLVVSCEPNRARVEELLVIPVLVSTLRAWKANRAIVHEVVWTLGAVCINQERNSKLAVRMARKEIALAATTFASDEDISAKTTYLQRLFDVYLAEESEEAGESAEASVVEGGDEEKADDGEE